MSTLKGQVNSSSNFASFFIVMTTNSPVSFKLIHFLLWMKESHRVLGSKFVKFLMLILNWQVNSSSIFISFFIVTTHNSTVNFKLIYFQLWTKDSHQSLNLETFKCSGEKLPNSSCYFPNHKLDFLQILHHSLVSWQINPLYFLGQTLPKRTNQIANFWDFSVLRSKFTKFLSLLKQQISFPSVFLSFLSAIKYNFSVLSKLKHYILWSKAAH